MKLKDPSLFKQQCYIAGAWVHADDGFDRSLQAFENQRRRTFLNVPVDAVENRVLQRLAIRATLGASLKKASAESPGCGEGLNFGAADAELAGIDASGGQAV